MTPSEFYNLYGPCFTRVYVAKSGVFEKINPEPGRYLMAFWRTTDSVRIAPDGVTSVDTLGAPFETTSSPLIFTHTEHGSLPSGGWQIALAPLVVFAQVLVVMGIAGGNVRR